MTARNSIVLHMLPPGIGLLRGGHRSADPHVTFACKKYMERAMHSLSLPSRAFGSRFLAVPYNINGYEWLKLEKEARRSRAK